MLRKGAWTGADQTYHRGRPPARHISRRVPSFCLSSVSIFITSWQVRRQKDRIHKGEKEAAKRLEKGKGSATDSESLPNRPPTIWGYTLTKPNGDTQRSRTCEANQSYCLQSSQPLSFVLPLFACLQRSAWPPPRGH
jgi:hypothetical protein